MIGVEALAGAFRLKALLLNLAGSIDFCSDSWYDSYSSRGGGRITVGRIEINGKELDNGNAV